jgi:hypothetical protein
VKPIRSRLPNHFIRRATENLSLDGYWVRSDPVPVFHCIHPPEFRDQYILRMAVRTPESGGFRMPHELNWLRPAIYACDGIQKQNGLPNQYVYVTVRSGEVLSQTDDDWHVDGFSMRVPHLPEQNYICASSPATEWQAKSFDVPDDFDPMRHNLHWLLQEQAEDDATRQCDPFVAYAIDPYCVHRRPQFNGRRLFWRVSFVAIAIEDDTCTPNPLLPMPRYGRRDIRESLVGYPLTPYPTPVDNRSPQTEVRSSVSS